MSALHQPHSAYVHDLGTTRGQVSPPPPGDLRAQELARPLVGDLIKPGMIVNSNYGTGPYRVETVNQYEVYPGFSCWSLAMIAPERDGTYRPGPPDSWINEVVVEWEGETPRFRKLFRANTDEVTIADGVAFKVSRTGQGVLL